MMADFGQDALLSILSHLVFIGLSFWALQATRLDQLLKPNHVFQARLLFVLLSIAIGSSVSNFFLDYLLWSRQLPLLLQ
ncbi:DUF1146 family protein [Bacillus thermotolerans]|uniref:DUF1146 domain-containing protein n=1 Tax=Bacillus thermotolerans TaxID=1221996 RepID=A0A0F5I6A4_BACTR|nr:DUF1146 family protein [Bacillus thermotolerans]KKB36535.1 hypothetical protein QY97_00934 [Bacillus thermotolerans]KKB40998.1 hypothetical protein QY95_01061 [Bacillus thermotolerans]